MFNACLLDCGFGKYVIAAFNSCFQCNSKSVRRSLEPYSTALILALTSWSSQCPKTQDVCMLLHVRNNVLVIRNDTFWERHYSFQTKAWSEYSRSHKTTVPAIPDISSALPDRWLSHDPRDTERWNLLGDRLVPCDWLSEPLHRCTETFPLARRYLQGSRLSPTWWLPQ